MEKSNHFKPVDYHTTTEWLECVSSSGKKYYYNSRTCQSTWEVPAEFIKNAKKYKAEKILDISPSPDHLAKKYKGEGLLLTPNAPSNGMSHNSLLASSRLLSPFTTVHSPVSTAAKISPMTPVAVTDDGRHESKYSTRPATSRRQSLNHKSSTSDLDLVSLHEGIPSPVIHKEGKRSNNSSHNSSPIHGKSDRVSTPQPPQKLSKLLNTSLSHEDNHHDITRTRFLDPASISLLANQSAELLERQSNQLHNDGRRLLDVDLLRTIADCANLRAVTDVQSLRAVNIEHKLEMLRNHIKWLEEGHDFT